MTINLFEDALSNEETDDFFRGKGKYLVPSPDYEGHVHGANIGGSARTYTENNKEHTKDFDSELVKFIGNLCINKDDLNHLLANLSAFFAQRSRGAFKYSNLFVEDQGTENLMLKEYIKKTLESDFSQEAKEQLIRHSNFMKRKGVDILDKIISQIDSQLDY